MQFIYLRISNAQSRNDKARIEKIIGKKLLSQFKWFWILLLVLFWLQSETLSGQAYHTFEPLVTSIFVCVLFWIAYPFHYHTVGLYSLYLDQAAYTIQLPSHSGVTM